MLPDRFLDMLESDNSWWIDSPTTVFFQLIVNPTVWDNFFELLLMYDPRLSDLHRSD